MSAANSAARSPSRPSPSAPPETVDPRWILKALFAVFGLGLLCAYVTLCAFFYVGQWQLVLKPSRSVAATPAKIGLAFQTVRFGDDLAGHPQISGWWVPGTSPADPTVLLLHGGAGSLADTVPQLATLHTARLNVLAIDYRGFGQSGGEHPTEARMRDDAASALAYLLDTRHVPQGELIVLGDGLGASLAAGLCAMHPGLPALILVDADGDTLTRVLADQRSRIVPLRLLFHERFPLADTLARLATPKLLISYTRSDAPLVAQRAAPPKTTVELPPAADPSETARVVRRFVDTYLPHPPPTLKPGTF